MASTPKFFASSSSGVVGLTNVLQDIVAGGANESFVNCINIINTGASVRTLTLADENDNVIGVLTIPASAGNTPSTPPVDPLNSRLMCRLEYDAYGNSGIRLKDATKKIRAKQDVGADLKLHYGKLDY